MAFAVRCAALNQRHCCTMCDIAVDCMATMRRCSRGAIFSTRGMRMINERRTQPSHGWPRRTSYDSHGSGRVLSITSKRSMDQDRLERPCHVAVQRLSSLCVACACVVHLRISGQWTPGNSFNNRSRSSIGHDRDKTAIACAAVASVVPRITVHRGSQCYGLAFWRCPTLCD